MESIVNIIKEESAVVLGVDSPDFLNRDSVISQHFDSFSFISLIEKLEKRFAIEFSDDDFYEESIVTIEDFANFILSQTGQPDALSDKTL